MYKFKLEHYAILVRNLRICDLRNLFADRPPLDLLVVSTPVCRKGDARWVRIPGRDWGGDPSLSNSDKI
jgi:hypothetical protein